MHNMFVYKISRAHYAGQKWFSDNNGNKFCKYYIQICIGRKNRCGKDTVFAITINATDCEKSQFFMLLEALLKTKHRNKIKNILSDNSISSKDKSVIYDKICGLIVDTIKTNNPHVSCRLKSFSNKIIKFDSIKSTNKNFYELDDFDWPKGFEPGCIAESDKLDIEGLDSIINDYGDIKRKQNINNDIIYKLSKNIDTYRTEITTEPKTGEWYLLRDLRLDAGIDLDTIKLAINHIFSIIDYFFDNRKKVYITEDGWNKLAGDLGVDNRIKVQAAISRDRYVLQELSKL